MGTNWVLFSTGPRMSRANDLQPALELVADGLPLQGAGLTSRWEPSPW